MYNVLIADDSKLQRTALASIISHSEGFTVVADADNKEDIVGKCENEKIDILFMNTIINGQSSIDVGREICNLDKGISIFIISSLKNDPNMIDLIKLGIEDYLYLPLTFSKVGAALDTYKEKNQRKYDDPYINRITELIKSRKSIDIYDTACDIVDCIKEEGEEIFEKRMIETVESINHQIEVCCGIVVDLVKKYPIDKALAGREIYWKLWLAEILDFTFRCEAVYHCDALGKVFELIDECRFDSIKLDYICRECNISEGYLNKKMREYMGVSTMDYFQRRKMLEAKKMLSFRTSMLGDIAYDLGYNESSYFSKVFKKYEGISPVQFRKKLER